MNTTPVATIAEIDAATAYDFTGLTDSEIYSLVGAIETDPSSNPHLAVIEQAFNRAALAEIERRAQKTYRVYVTLIDPRTGWKSVQEDFFTGTPADFSDFYGPHNWTKGSGVVEGPTGKVDWEIVDTTAW
jgi:hypothetical protein